MRDPNLNRILANRYQLQQVLGAGAMGQVYLAHDKLLGGVPVAVKLLSISIHNKKLRVQERFEQEAKTCAILGQKSIHIVRVMDYGVVEENGTPFYVMEYLKGKNLSDMIRNYALSLPRFLSIGRQISLGLECAHQGIPVDGKTYPIIHRDIKPSNVLLIQDNSLGELAKLLDFGIAKLLQADSSQTRYYMGTFAYSSPEQMEGSELTNRSDIYSLGVMLFEMLTGNIPIQANTDSFGGWFKAHHYQPPRSFETSEPKFPIPPQLKDLVMSCLAKAPSDRPQNVSEIIKVFTLLEQPRDRSLPLTTQPITPQTPSSSIEPANTIVAPQQGQLTTDAICRLTRWPQNKPIADIVFPQSIQINGEESPALWVMLSQTEVNKRLVNRTYNHFLFITSPSPMMLWITALHHRTYGTKWLTYYLDLKNSQNRDLIQSIGIKGYYRVLLFARETPQYASSCLLINVAHSQGILLQQWYLLSQSSNINGDAQLSKNLLKQEYEKIKPQILMKLEASV
ncbi:serine/threonine-protein kinase [Scytonema millei]|uniref:non-specific serine/threonine protein kinase n=1 Tax=Scytonema millei VB511283 TaxID=1245923 RepID=A0A9X5I709_9CYAN|nr:serine/threonine-protein kinase [Scytonema millei]NHC37620.1 serine/threonine protein kinase [Scytonema millei VB511283]